MQNNIILIGAYGFTGAMIARKLIAKNIFPVLAGKNIDKLIELQQSLSAKTDILQIDINGSVQIKEKLIPFDIIVNCVGPFNLFGNGILDYAIATGKVYLDICGEQAFIKKSFDRKNEIKEQGACIIHSLAFESCMADLMAVDIVDSEINYKEISSYYYFKDAKYSRGSRYSMQAMKLFSSYIYENNTLKEAIPLSVSKQVAEYVPGCTEALFVPYPELLFFASKYNTRNAGTYYLMEGNEAAFAKANKQQQVKSREELTRKYDRQNAGGPTEEERNNQHFSLIVEAVTEEDNYIHKLIQGNDTYELSATIMVEAINVLINRPNNPSGLLLPSDLFFCSNLLDELFPG